MAMHIDFNVIPKPNEQIDKQSNTEIKVSQGLFKNPIMYPKGEGSLGCEKDIFFLIYNRKAY